MRLVKLGAACLNTTPRDWKGNLANILEAIRIAKEKGVNFLCLPELCITGYGMEDDFFCADVPHRAMKQLAKIAGASQNIVVCVGLPVLFNNTLYNAVATIVDGVVVGFTCKQHLAGDGIHYEHRQFKPWPAGVVQYIECRELESARPIGSWRVPIGSWRVPIGDVHFNICGIKLAYEICEDAWVANRPGTTLAGKGIDIYFNPSASHFAFGKLTTRRNFVVDGSRAFNASYVYATLVGNEAGRAIYDGTCLIASGGKLLAQGKRFTFKNVLLTTAVVDVDSTKTSQVRTASFQPDVEHYNKGCVEVRPMLYNFPSSMGVSVEPSPWEETTFVKEHECTRAIGLALMDYMRKSKTDGFVVSLSGGRDSAAVTYLAAMGIRLGVEELGPGAFIEKFCPRLMAKDVLSEKALFAELITTAYQPTAQSGEVTQQAAREVANALGVPLHVLNVEPAYQVYKKLGEQVAGRELSFEKDGLSLQNLQARLRNPPVWMIANMQNKLLLTTSNMSEAAVGYCTMDGDTAGCVAPIAGLDKDYVKTYLEWVENLAPEMLRVRAMKYINAQVPTAELLPSKYKQTDETDLMPYWILAKISRMVVINRYSPKEIYDTLKRELKIENNQLIGYIVKYFKLFSRNQWKRERYAPSFHLDDYNLDPRTWCRMPILSGGYEEELEELSELKTK